MAGVLLTNGGCPVPCLNYAPAVVLAASKINQISDSGDSTMAQHQYIRGKQMTDEEVRELKVDDFIWVDYYHNYSKQPHTPAVSGAFKILSRGQDSLHFGQDAYIDLRKLDLTENKDGRSEYYHVETVITRPANNADELVDLLKHALSVMVEESCDTGPEFHFEQFTSELNNPDWGGTLRLTDEGKSKTFQLVIRQLTDWDT